jgi:E3 ubiquitin-protein ligase RNF19A
LAAEKTSLGSARSFRSSDLDTTSLSSMHKRIIQRIPSKLNATQHRTMSLDSNSGSNNIPETMEPEEHIIDMPTTTQEQTPQQQFNSAASVIVMKNGKSPTPVKKELSKTNILRNIFFSGSSSTAAASSSSPSSNSKS